jgi:hypothetical protein
MTFERNPAPPAEPAPGPVLGSAAPGAGPTPVQLRLQILSTEHWSLLASRGLAWNETFARAGMYLSTLSGAMVALGLIAGIDKAGDIFFTFALVILPVVLFVGIGTWIRMGASNYHDAMTVFGMNRIRGAYLEIAPELEPYFVMGIHDDPRGIGITMGVPPGTPPIAHLVASTPFLVVVLNSVVAGAIGALVLVRFTALEAAAVLVGALIIAAIVLLAHMRYARARIREGQNVIEPMFPTPGASQGPTPPHGSSASGRSTGSRDRPGA